MAEKKLTDASIASASEIADGDIFHMVDVSDTTDDPTGTSKKTSFSLVKDYFVSTTDEYKVIPSTFDWSSIPAGHNNSSWEINDDFDLTGIDVTLPSNVVLIFNGGKLSNYTTLTGDNTSILADYSTQIFDSTGTIDGDWSIGKASPNWFGAKGDWNGTTGTDNNEAFLKTKEFCLDEDIEFYIPAGGRYYIAGDLDLWKVKNVNIEASIVGDGSNEIVCGYSSNTSQPTKYKFFNTEDVVLKFQGIKNAYVDIKKADEVIVWADGDYVTPNTSNKEIHSAAYNHFVFGFVVTLKLHSELTSSDIGWINQNHFWINRITNLYVDGNYPHNNNIFYNTTFENSVIDFEQGTSNIFRTVRFEGTVDLTFSENTHTNLFELSWNNTKGSFYQNKVPTYTDLGVNNNVAYVQNIGQQDVVLLDINPTSENYDLAHIVRNGNNELKLTNNFQDIFFTEFIKIETDFGVSFESISAFRFTVYVYDETKTAITTVEDPNVVVGDGYTWNSAGYYTVSANVDSRALLIMKSGEATYVKIQLLSGNAVDDTTFEKIVIKARYDNKTYLSIPLNVPNTLVASSIPTEGTWGVGDRVYNTAPTASGYIGWVCVTAGTPGTWKGFGTIQA